MFLELLAPNLDAKWFHRIKRLTESCFANAKIGLLNDISGRPPIKIKKTYLQSSKVMSSEPTTSTQYFILRNTAFTYHGRWL